MYIKFRLLEKEDYNKGYLKLLEQLTDVGNVTKNQFDNIIDNNLINKDIYVIEDISTQKLIGTGSILYEQKFIHNCAKYAYIEDLVISSQYRGKNYGRSLMIFLLQKIKENNCQRVYLRSNKKNISFYKKLEFETQLSNFVLRRLI